MKVLLTQLRVRSEDAAQNFRAVAKLIERSRLGLSHLHDTSVTKSHA